MLEDFLKIYCFFYNFKLNYTKIMLNINIKYILLIN